MGQHGPHWESCFYWNTTTGNNSSTNVSLSMYMWKSNVKNIFHIISHVGLSEWYHTTWYSRQVFNNTDLHWAVSWLSTRGCLGRFYVNVRSMAHSVNLGRMTRRIPPPPPPHTHTHTQDPPNTPPQHPNPPPPPPQPPPPPPTPRPCCQTRS